MKTAGVTFNNSREHITFTMANGVLRCVVSSKNARQTFAVELGAEETAELRDLLNGEK